MRIDAFDLQPGHRLAGRYEVMRRLGAGWESEVYLVRELTTGIERAAKLFFPERNVNNRIARLTALKLHQLRMCPALLQYITQDVIEFRNTPVSMLVSDFVDGQLLKEFLADQPGRRLPRFEALHVLWSLACALEPIHDRHEYHGDLHDGNIIIVRRGLGFDIKLIDIFHRPRRRSLNIQDDVVDLIRIFYDLLGGQRTYARQPRQVKNICRGLKRSLISERFRHASQLRRHLERLPWDDE